MSFLSETSGIAIESGDFFSYRRPSKKQVPFYKSDSDISSNDGGVIYSPKKRHPIECEPTVGIIGTTPPIKNNRPLTIVSTQGNKV